jgi:ABC-2 type transport system permease protein
MTPSPMLAIVKNELRVFRRDPAYLIVLIAMPIVIMGFTKEVFRPGLLLEGVDGANGAEQSVPGMAVMFSFFLVGNFGFVVFREHGWNTWDRLRSYPIGSFQLLAAKAVLPIITLALQITVLLTLGGLIYALNVRGSLSALTLVVVAHLFCLAGLALLVVGVCRSVMQVNAISNMGAVLIAGIGGAITPFIALPIWAQRVAPASPAYWTMDGFNRVIVEGGGVGDVLVPVAALAAMGVVFGVIGAMRFNVSDQKTGWA